jgi:hypothetical protein
MAALALFITAPPAVATIGAIPPAPVPFGVVLAVVAAVLAPLVLVDLVLVNYGRRYF